MNIFHGILAAGLLVVMGMPAFAQDTGRHFPAPDTVSPQLKQMIDAAPPTYWNAHPGTTEEWKAWASSLAQEAVKGLPELREKLGVSVIRSEMGGVPVFIFTPEDLPEANRDRVLLNLHGGGYVLGAGESGTLEAVLMAGMGKFKVVYADYRMAPDFPWPAAIDDAIAVYRELLTTTAAESIGVFGTSTGGGMTLILAMRAREEGLPLPAALAAGTPWTDLSKCGDTYATNEGVDNILVSYDGWLGDAARLYAAGHDLRDPMLSPVYGDVKGFPPTMLTSGTRDLFLSNTVRMHLKLREAGVPADLMVFEGMSHAQYHMSADAPETQFHFREVGKFFDRYLKQR